MGNSRDSGRRPARWRLSTLALAALLAAQASCIGGDPRKSAAADAAPDAPATSLGAVDAGRPVAVAKVKEPVDAGPAAIARGAELYGLYCDFCHGAKGEGYAADEAPRLASKALLGAASDDFLRHAIVEGRPGTTMSAWSQNNGGPLRDEGVDALVAFLRSLGGGPSAPAGEASAAGGVGDRAKAVYAERCASCHGDDAKPGKYAHLANPSLLASASDAFLATAIRHGRPGTPMPAWGSVLGEASVADLVALLRSWQKPADAKPALPPRPGEPVDVVINPKGREPSFAAKADFVPVDEVKRALDGKARLVILDARASGDYARMHVAGAVSVPFYEVDAYAAQLPKNAYVLTYCACPHAASVKLRDALRKLGYPRVAVLDEGILTWRDRGYPVRGGAKP